MALVKPLILNPAGPGSEEMLATDSLQLGGLTMSGDIAMATNKITGLGAGSASGDALSYGQSSASLAGLTLTADLAMGSQQITGLADGSSSDHAVNKSQLDNAVLIGGKVREHLLHESQVNDAEGILSAIALTVQTNPVAGDTLVLTDGTTTRTYGATSGGDVQYTIGATIADTMANIAAAINGDGSSIWSVEESTDLDSIDTDSVLVIIEDDNDGTASKVYGTWATPASVQVVNYEDEGEYTKKTLTNMPGSAPANSNFGFRRTKASLTPGEIHVAENDDTQYYWDSDSETWYTMSGQGSIPDATSGSGGATKGKVTFDSDFGLSVTTGIAKINANTASGGLEFATGALQVKGNASKAIVVEAAGVGIDLADTNPCLEFSSGIGLLLNGTTLEKTGTGARVKGLPLQFEINAVATNNTFTAAAANALTGGVSSNADSYHTHTTLVNERLEDELTAEETLAKGDPVEWGSVVDKVRKCMASTAAKVDIMGVVEESAGISADAVGTVVRLGPCRGVLSGASPSTRYYVGDSGGLVTSLAAISAGNHVVYVGSAINATDLEVRTQYISRK